MGAASGYLYLNPGTLFITVSVAGSMGLDTGIAVCVGVNAE